MPPYTRVPLCWLVVVALTACDKDGGPLDVDVEPRVLRVLELTFQDIGSPSMRASVLIARSIAELESARASGASRDSLISFQLITVGVLDVKTTERTRFVHATFRTNNLLDAAAGRDVTLIGISTAQMTVNTLVRPTGLARFDENGSLHVDSANVLRVLTVADTSGLVRPTGVGRIFDFGFVVRADGLVSFGFALPLMLNPQDDIQTLSVLLMAVRDPD